MTEGGDTPLPFQIGAPQLGAMLDAIPARIALLDPHRRHRYVNREYARFFDMLPRLLLGRTVEEVIGSAGFEIVRGHGDRALAGETVNWEGWLPYAEGADQRFVQHVYVPHRDASGTVLGYFIFARDLTELKLGERRLSGQLADLRMSQALNAAITASALDCVIVIDETGCVVEFNPAAEKTFGHRRADVLGRAIGDIIVPPHLRERHAKGFARYIATGEAHVLGRRIEIEGLRADGEVFPLELAITEVRLPDRRLFTAYLRDLTAAKAADAQIQHSRDALHQSEKMAAFGSLLAGVAHELNNPLSIVIGNAMMLSEDASGTDRLLSDRADKIHAAAERCARIVRTFLSMARQRQIQLRPLSLLPLIHESLELLAYGLRTSGIAVDLDLPEDLPQAVGDPDQLNQVFVNLVINAQQALASQPPPRRIAVTARAGADHLTLCVADNGPGVPPQIRGRIFDPFFTTKTLGAGTGIGLAVSRGIVEAHGGTLVLAAEDAGGARFEVTLRRATASDVVTAPVTASAPAAARPVKDRALIVDDEPEVAAILAHLVSALGYRCDSVQAAIEACRSLERLDYDIVFCDLHMPEMSGSMLFDWVALHQPRFCERFVFITADTLGQAATSFLARAGRPVLEKPFVPDEIRRVVAALRDGRTEGASAPP